VNLDGNVKPGDSRIVGATISMQRAVKIEASLACANFKNLERDIKQLEEAKIDYFHFDIIDGNFVPNFALDFTILGVVRELSRTDVVCHLMIEEPERYIERAAAFKPAFISIHLEATRDVQRALQHIRNSGVRPGIVLNPATPVSALQYILDDIDLITVMTVNPGFVGQVLIPATIRKLADVRKLIDAEGCSHIELEVDGNVSFQNIPTMIKSGATMLVGGTSSVFSRAYTIGEAVAKVRELTGPRTVH
jgi:ribulose-phosphate 3-epimerase